LVFTADPSPREPNIYFPSSYISPITTPSPSLNFILFVMAGSDRTLVVIGSGPGIGRSVTALFASKRYSNVALIARRAEKLEEEEAALKQAVGEHINVKTFAVDVVDTEALLKALADAESHFGKAECIFYNAARVLPSQLLTHEAKEIEYDFKVSWLDASFIGLLHTK
jgi:NAD(P)-dependent dehydrogenase (short-subunit alcohol dehydrogenase family)